MAPTRKNTLDLIMAYVSRIKPNSSRQREKEFHSEFQVPLIFAFLAGAIRCGVVALTD